MDYDKVAFKQFRLDSVDVDAERAKKFSNDDGEIIGLERDFTFL